MMQESGVRTSLDRDAPVTFLSRCTQISDQRLARALADQHAHRSQKAPDGAHQPARRRQHRHHVQVANSPGLVNCRPHSGQAFLIR